MANKTFVKTNWTSTIPATPEQINRMEKGIDDAISHGNENEGLISEITVAQNEAEENISTLQKDLTAEVKRAGEAEKANKGAIDGEISRAKGAEKENKDAIDAEIKRAKGEEESLKAASASSIEFETNASSGEVKAKLKNASGTEVSSATVPPVGFKKYSDEYFDLMFVLGRSDSVYSVDIPKWETSQSGICTKSNDNVGLVALPSTAAEHRQDDYDSILGFVTIDVNAEVDDNGVRHVTAIKGDPEFDDKTKDVFVLGMSYYEKWEDLGNGYLRYSRSFVPKDGFEISKLCINRDGTVQPYFLIAKYLASKGADGLLYSVKNRVPATYIEKNLGLDIAYSNSIGHCAKRGKFYSIGLPDEYSYINTTWFLKYADMNSQNTMGGCFGYNTQCVVAVEEDTANKYVILTAANANNFPVGGGISVGYGAVDRVKAECHQLVYGGKVLSKETMSDGNVKVNIDCETPFKTTKSNGTAVYATAFHWKSGFSDMVKGRCGEPCDTVQQLTSMTYPIVFQGVEIAVGAYETQAGFSICADSTGKRNHYSCRDASLATRDPSETSKGYVKIGEITFSPCTANNWNYIDSINFTNGVVMASHCGAEGSGTAKGVGDGCYMPGISVGAKYELRALGSLWNRSDGGLSCLYLYDGLSHCGWILGARLSVNAVGGDLLLS